MYQALYRKYRPRIFDDVISQEHITATLKNQVAGGRLSHAYLFIGTRGTGKTTCARILARAVNCLAPEDGNPCNKCAACLGIEDGSILDVVELDAASNNGVDNVRALREEAVFTPASVKKRVYIIDEVHMLSTAAFNALLKILEEPPEHLLFVLATTELHKVPATILSRCQRHSFRRIDATEISKYLGEIAALENIPLTAQAATLIARLADGAMRDALSLLDQCAPLSGELNEAAVLETVGLAGSRKTAELLENILYGSLGDALDVFDALWRGGKNPATILSELSALMRDILIAHIAPRGGGGLLSGAYDNARLSGFARSAGASSIMRGLEVLEAALADMRTSANPRLSAELCLMRLANPLLGGDTAALEARIAALENALSGGGFTSRAQEAEPVKIEVFADITHGGAPEISESTDNGKPPWEDTPHLEYAQPFDDSEPRDDDPPTEDAPPWDTPIKTADIPLRASPLTETPAAQDAPPAPVPTPNAATATGYSGTDFRKILCNTLPTGTAVGSVMILLNHSMSYVEVSGSVVSIIVAGNFEYSQINKTDFLSAVTDAASQILGAPATVTIKRGEIPKQDAPRRSLNELSRLGNVVFED